MNADLKERFETTRDLIARQWVESINREFREAILKAEGGTMPDNETLQEQGHIVIDASGTYHLLWRCRKPVLGEKPDMTTCIASVAPPRIYTPPCRQQFPGY